MHIIHLYHTGFVINEHALLLTKECHLSIRHQHISMSHTRTFEEIVDSRIAFQCDIVFSCVNICKCVVYMLPPDNVSELEFVFQGLHWHN